MFHPSTRTSSRTNFAKHGVVKATTLCGRGEGKTGRKVVRVKKVACVEKRVLAAIEKDDCMTV